MKQDHSWREKVLRASRGTQTGAVIAAILGREIPAPCYLGKAFITSDGYVMCAFKTKTGETKPGAFVSDVAGVTDGLRAVVHHCKLTSEQATSLYNAAKAWVANDYRSVRTWPV